LASASVSLSINALKALVTTTIRARCRYTLRDLKEEVNVNRFYYENATRVILKGLILLVSRMTA
jgi:hypothetical protein